MEWKAGPNSPSESRLIRAHNAKKKEEEKKEYSSAVAIRILYRGFQKLILINYFENINLASIRNLLYN